MNSTDTTNHGAFAEQLLTSCRGLFSTILLADAGCDETWTARLETMRKHGLLTVRLPSPFQPQPIEIDQSRLDSDSRYRKRVAKKLAAPRPSKWTYVNLSVDRARFQADETYRSELCHYFAARWIESLVTSDAVERLVLLKLSPEQLRYCLSELGPHQLSATTVQQYVLRHLAEELVDNNPRFHAIQGELKAACAKVRHETMESVRKITDEFRAERLREMDAADAEVRKRFDDAIEGIRERIRANAERSAAALAESTTTVDPETEWRESLAARERAFKEANRWSPTTRWLVTLAVAALAGTFVMFGEVNGVSVTDLLFGSSDTMPVPATE